MVYKSSSFWRLALGSHDLSQAEKEMFVLQSWANFTKWQQFSLKMVLSRLPFWVKLLSTCQFVNLNSFVITSYFSAWDKSRDPRANKQKLEDMYTTLDEDCDEEPPADCKCENLKFANRDCKLEFIFIFFFDCKCENLLSLIHPLFICS